MRVVGQSQGFFQVTNQRNGGSIASNISLKRVCMLCHKADTSLIGIPVLLSATGATVTVLSVLARWLTSLAQRPDKSPLSAPSRTVSRLLFQASFQSQARGSPVPGHPHRIGFPSQFHTIWRSPLD